MLIVPGLLVAARWSLMAPAIMLEGKLAFSAKDRSVEIVRGKIDDRAIWIVLSALAVPFQVYALSVLYYRLVDPQRPAIDPQVRTWPSVWAGP